MFSSPVVSLRCVGLDVAWTFNFFLTGYNVTVVDRSVSNIGVSMSRLRGFSGQDGPSVLVCDEAIIDVGKAMFGCSVDFSENFLAVA